MTTAERAEKFVNSYGASRAALESVTEEAARNILKLLEKFRKEIIDRLVYESPDDPNAPFDVRALPNILRSIEEAIEILRSRGLKVIEKKLDQSFDLGQDAAIRAIRTQLGRTYTPFISPSLLLTLGRTPAYIYTEMTQRLANAVENEVRKSMAGFQNHIQTVHKIATIIGSSDEAKEGFRGRTSYVNQAQEIIRTETGRAYSSAHQAVSQDATKLIPDMQKMWFASDGARRGHLEAEQAYKPGGKFGPIPVNDRFEVVDYSRTGTTEFLTTRAASGAQRVVHVRPYQRQGTLITDHLLFPRDPEGSPGNVIRCRCEVLNVFPEFKGMMNDMLAGIKRLQEEK